MRLLVVSCELSVKTMIIVLHGENSFLTKRKRDEIVGQYKAKHPQGVSLFVFEEKFDLGDFKVAIETVSLFDAKRLVVLKDALSEVKESNLFFELLKSGEVKSDKDTVVVVSESEKIEPTKNERLKWLLEKPSVVQEAKHLAPAQLSAWIHQEVARVGGEIDAAATALLVFACGADLWRLSSEIAKLVAYDAQVTKKSVDALVAQEPEGEVFLAIGALASGDKKTAAREFHALLAQGEDWTRLFAMVVFQFRSLLKVRSLLDLHPHTERSYGVGASYDFAKMQKATGMHPYTLRKTVPLAQTYTTEKLKEIKGIYNLVK